MTKQILVLVTTLSLFTSCTNKTLEEQCLANNTASTPDKFVWVPTPKSKDPRNEGQCNVKVGVRG